MVVASFNKSCPCKQTPLGSSLVYTTSSWVRAARDADVLRVLPTSPHLPHRVITVRATCWAIITSAWHTQQERCLQVNTVQILALLTSKLEHADNKAHPGESPSPLPWRGWPGLMGGGGNSGGGVRERGRRCEVAFDSTAPAASSLPGSASPFVSTDRLARTEGIRAGGGFNQEACWWGRVVLIEVGGCCCVIRHTLCHPSGTFQLSVATNTAVVGWWRVCPHRPLIHIHSCAQWHVSYWCYHQWSQARGFFSVTSITKSLN